MACWHQKNLRFFVLLKHRKSYKMPLFFFCEILGLWNTTGYGANWFKLGICWLDSSVFTRKADLSAIHFLNTSLQFVKRCCIIVKKWQGSKIHVVNLLKFHQRTKNSCIQLFQCLPLHVYVKDSSLQPFCRLGRLELSQFAGTCQGSQWNGGWTHAKDRATLHLKHPKAAEDPSDATTQARFHRLNRLMPPLLWTRRIVGSWDRGWLAGRHEQTTQLMLYPGVLSWWASEFWWRGNWVCFARGFSERYAGKPATSHIFVGGTTSQYPWQQTYINWSANRSENAHA